MPSGVNVTIFATFIHLTGIVSVSVCMSVPMPVCADNKSNGKQWEYSTLEMSDYSVRVNSLPAD